MESSNENRLTYCYMNEEMEACEADAEWFVVYGAAPEDYTFACSEHLGLLLGDEPYFQIWPISKYIGMISNE